MRPAVFLACAALLFLAAPALADGEPGPNVESSVDSTRLRDDLRGVSTDPAQEIRIGFVATAGSRLAVTLTGDPSQTAAATGLSLTLCTADGSDLEVAGGPFDRSRPGRDEVRYRRVLLETTGSYVMIVRVTGAGGWRLRLAGSRLATRVATAASEPDTVLDVGERDSIDFEGLAGGSARFALLVPRRSRFRGRLVSVQRPDGSFLSAPPETARGRLELDADGTHTLLFENVGRAGTWRARVTARPPGLRLRRGYVGVNETALVPVVTRVLPGKGVQRDTSLRVRVLGRDFQSGPDVRLVRGGRDPILATDVDVVSETELECTLNLDTTESAGKNSIGTWRFGVWNMPEYGDPDDRDTLVADSPTKDTRKRFKSVSSGTVRLPRGVKPDTEVWYLDFNDAFQVDLNRMGLGSSDRPTRDIVREVLEAYVTAYLRDLFRVNETTGALSGSGAIPVSFVIGSPPSIAGEAGVDYNRIEIGGQWESGDPSDEPLAWGFAPLDLLNRNRENLTLLDADGNRVGQGARTRILDPDGGDVAPSLQDALQPLRNRPLGTFFALRQNGVVIDLDLFSGRFRPQSQSEIDRYADVVTAVERAAREIAAIVAHHIGRAMGLTIDGVGPMASPSTAGEMWPERPDLSFVTGDASTLRDNAVAHDLPGRSDPLRISFFPLRDGQLQLLRNELDNQPYLTTGDPFLVTWNFVGGRCNARPGDYRVQYVRGSNPPLDQSLAFESLSGTSRNCIVPGVCQNVNDIYFDVSVFQLAVTDVPRETVSFHFHRLKVVPDPLDFPAGVLRQGAQQKRDLVLNAE